MPSRFLLKHKSIFIQILTVRRKYRFRFQKPENNNRFQQQSKQLKLTVKIYQKIKASLLIAWILQTLSFLQLKM